jgi:hypothetical protein
VALQYPHRANLAPRVRAVVDHLLAAFEGNADLQMGRQDLGDALARWVA